jgi:hypothetical protein
MTQRRSRSRDAGAFVLQTTFWFLCFASILVSLLLFGSDLQSFRYVGF